jgi:hypothetical protein
MSYDAAAEKEKNVIGARNRRREKARKRSVSRRFAEMLNGAGVRASLNAVNNVGARLHVPTAYQLLAVCRVLGVEDALSWFCSDVRPPLNQEGLQRVREYREVLIASGMFAPPRAVPEEPVVLLPTYSLRASAGNGNFLDSSDFEVIGYSKSEVPAGADFALYVGGDSMEPVYHDGQLVWVHKCRALRPGEVGIFSCDNEGYIKMYAEREPEHPEGLYDERRRWCASSRSSSPTTANIRTESSARRSISRTHRPGRLC